MRTHPLTPESLTLLKLHTSTPKFLSDSHHITDWFSGPPGHTNTYSRFIYDHEGLDGLHRDFFRIASVVFAPESSSWRWQAFLSPGARYGLVKGEPSSMQSILTAMQKADAYLELYSLYRRDYTVTIGESNIQEPFEKPLLHPSRPWRTTSWHCRSVRDRPKTKYIQRFIRTWVYTDAGVLELAPLRRTNNLVQPTSHSKPAASVTVRSRTKIEWEVSVPPNYESGTSKTLEEAFRSTKLNLEFLGCKHHNQQPAFNPLPLDT